MAYKPIPDGELAAVVTFLEMHSPPVELPPPSPLSLWKQEQMGVGDYRSLFRQVGSRWLWFSRLVMVDSALAAIIHDPQVELFAIVSDDKGEVGMLELDFRAAGECEIAFVGLVPEMAGQGHGRWLLAQALHLAWRDGISRVHVHTCSLDHPAALSAYRRAGFTAYRRAIERFPDPRPLGILHADCAPQVPLLGTFTAAPSPPS
ncbi:GNAT family N-acetyltransferase [Sphingomonas sp.]|uniref:GNAT family N-acetyltransferase n=1 Tax=Sphingomonas sp. TaxID=28214 RepID=UPI00286BEB25|nr:GNAT family N-acetyltransferase [Sphingomonas sp.]